MAISNKYNRVIGLSVQLGSDGSQLIHTATVSNSKGKLTIEDISEFDSMGAMIKKIGKASPFLLNIYGHGVLDKKVENLVPGEVNITGKAIPGIKTSDYYFSEFIYDNYGWVSLAKRTPIDDLIIVIRELGGYVIGLNIGFAGICDLAKTVGLNGSFSINGNDVTIDQGSIQSIARTDGPNHEVSIEGQELSSAALLSYSPVLNYYIDAPTSVNDIVLLADLSKGYAFQRKSSNILKAGLAAIMLIALGNAYFFNEAYQANESLKVTVQSQQPLLEKVSTLKAQKDQLEAAVGPLNSATTQQAYFIDQIGASLSEADIQLTSLDIYPSTSDRKKISAGVFEFDGDLIIIEGTSKDPARFGQWVNALRDLEWVESVEISPFQRNEAGENGFVVKVGV